MANQKHNLSETMKAALIKAFAAEGGNDEHAV